MIDPSSHYKSERAIGKALSEALEKNIVAREEIVIMTKVGHDSGSQMPDVDGKTTVEVGENSVYSLDPDFVEAEIAKSAEKLGTVPDCVLLHNPEWLLSSFR